MTMGVGNQDPHVGFMGKNQPWSFSNSDNSCERKKKKDHMKPTNQKDGNEGEALVNKKRSRWVVSGSEKNNTNGEKRKDGKCRKSDHETHIWIERERRKKMRNMFDSLHDLLPHLPSKTDKSTIVDEAVNHIKKLQQTLQKLEKKKQERLQSVSPLRCESSVTNSQWHPYDSNEAVIPDHHGSSNNNLSTEMATSNPQLIIGFQTWFTPNLVLNICGDEAQLCIYATKKPGLLTTIAFVLENHNIDVISANILCEGNGNACKILAHVKRASHPFQDANSTGERYVQAAEEIAKWVA